MNASANSVAYNGASTISWSSTNTTSCTSSGGGGTGTSGSFGTGGLTSGNTYTVSCTGSGGTVSKNVYIGVAPPVVAGCSTTGATSAISLSNLPNRLSGVAPLSVFFDASGTTAPAATTKPFHELDYRWSFGDAAGSPVSGTTWQYGSRANVSSRNAALGPLASHVFEVPGTYAVSLTVTDGTNTVSNNCTQIVVQDPEVVYAGTKTVCFSAAANFANCPNGAARVQTSNFANAINTYAATGKRLLFSRGEVFSAASAAQILVNGPGTIGAYGVSNAAKPVFKRLSSQYDTIFSLGQNSPTVIGDWRIMDIDLDGQNIVEAYNVGIDAAGQFNQLLALRLNIHGTWRGVAASHWALPPGRAIYDGWAIVDSVMSGIPNCNSPGNFQCDWRVYIAGKNHTVQGNSMDNEDWAGSHVIRSEYLAKGIISNNYIARAGLSQHAIKLHAWKWGGGSGGNSMPGTYSEDVIISDNRIVGGINPWTVAIEPQNDGSDERVRSVIFERNLVTAGSGTQIGVNSSAAGSTFRNNIFTIGSVADHHTGILITQRGSEAIPDDVKVYNNTIYSSMAGDFVGVSVGAATNVTVKNNLGYAPASTIASPNVVSMIDGVGSAVAVVTANSSNFQIKNTSPIWASATPSVAADFKVSGSSYAVGAGAVVPVFTDFFGLTRLVPELGAVLH
ncbi:MAG: PKD domain-containing protein [Burkholderiales bacterium]|nr:PKD domain-containing protein [Burkholderiales bacterium]